MVKFAHNKSTSNSIMYENVQYAPIPYIKDGSFDLYQSANDNDNYDIVQIVAGVEKVRQVVCYKMGNGEVLVGVLSEPLFSLTERLTLLQSVENTVKEYTKNNVYVTLDTDLFVAITKCKEDAKASQIKEFIIRRNSARM